MKIYFHIGYPKAGSSMLQKYFFNNHPEINYLGSIPNENTGIVTEKPAGSHYENYPELKLFIDHLVSDAFQIENPINHIWKKLASKTLENENVSVFSSEFVTSTFFCFPDIEEKINRIHSLGFNGVIIVIRNQVKLIKSQYREHPFDPANLIHGKPIGIDEWVKKSNTLQYSYLESLKYDRTIDLCNRLFGEENVIVLTFKDITKPSIQGISSITEPLELDKEKSFELLNNAPIENRGVSSHYNLIRNLKKKIFGEFPISNYLPDPVVDLSKKVLKKGKKAEYILNDETVSFLNDYFHDSNKQLEKLVDIDLQMLNYPPHFREKTSN
ncbi:hypothetical protein [Marinoscillum sp.]|uniref:hypothetical protein n=1 Tax=Marinoscillum sp. TaxID=2024838 RepID=UPI003BAB946A